MNDYARLLPADARQGLESRLAERERATGAQMVIAIFPSLEGESLEDFGVRLAERWRVGDKRLDRGVILLVFVQERRVRLEVGYGLEPVLPDAAAGQIIREAVSPRFREQRYAEGLQAAVEAVYARIEGGGAASRPAVPPAPRRHGVGASEWTLGVLVVFGIIALIMARESLGSRGRARRHGYTTGGARGRRRRQGATAGDHEGWSLPLVLFPPAWGGGSDSGGGGGIDFTPGGGSFGGGGASGDW